MRTLPKILALLAAVTLTPVCAHARGGGKWLSYEPAVVELRGRLRLVPRFGPPNYGENPESDLRVKIPVLDLAKPINVRRDPNSNLNWKSFRGVTRVQLAFGSDEELDKAIHELVGSDVVIRGSLFQSHTGHHYTDVLLHVEEIRRADR